MVSGMAGCGSGTGGVSERDVDFVVAIDGASSDLAIDYALTNRGDHALVAYNRLESRGSDGGFTTDVDRVYVIRDGDVLEIAKRIDHPCHDNPEGEDCGGEYPDAWRIGGTLVEPGERLQERIELPARGEPGFIETRGESVKFCLGVAVIDEDNQATPDGLYPPTSPQTILCSEPVTIES
jgi:hypothetical protein